MITVGFAIRQVAAFVCAGTLAWDYCRDPAVLGNFAIWTLLVHFAYFQLPLRSQALPYLHPASFIGACLMPVMYILMWVWTPSIETLHMEQWDQSWKTVVVRAVLINLAPLVFHILDITINRKHIINEYKPKPKKLGLLWSFCSFPLLGLLFELFFPESEELNDLREIDRESFLKLNQMVCFAALLVAFAVLYLLVLRKAIQGKLNSGHNLAHPQPDRNSPRLAGGLGSNSNSPH